MTALLLVVVVQSILLAQNNLSLIGVVSSSYAHKDNTPDKAIDGNKETFWATEVSNKKKFQRLNLKKEKVT